uniref:Uncharacterized protein n=1 Tax=Rhodnius prolixus TaxID=13249 RepID=T1HRX7_RHOPR
MPESTDTTDYFNAETDKDDEDSGSVHLMDGKTREWLVRCAQGDYQAIVKLAAENPKLVKFKPEPECSRPNF